MIDKTIKLLGKRLPIIQVIYCTIETIFFSGIAFGWPSIVYILKKEKYFVDRYCPQNSTTPNSTFTGKFFADQNGCSAQDEALNLVFTIATSCFGVISVLIGQFMDKMGIMKTRLVLLCCMGYAGLMFSLLSIDNELVMFPALVLLCGAGLQFMIVNMRSCSAFPNYSSTITNLQSASLDASGFLFILFQASYVNLDISLQTSFQIWTASLIIPICATIFFLPNSKFYPPEYYDHLQKKMVSGESRPLLSGEFDQQNSSQYTNPDISDPSLNDEMNDEHAFDQTNITNYTSVKAQSNIGRPRHYSQSFKIHSTSLDREHHTSYKKSLQRSYAPVQNFLLSGHHVLPDEDGDRSVNTGLCGMEWKSIRECICSLIFLFIVLWYCTFSLYLNYFIGSFNKWIQFLSHNDEAVVSKFTTAFGGMLFCGIFFSPICGSVLDYRMSRGEKSRGLKNSIIMCLMTWSLSVAVPLLSFISKPIEIQYLSFALFAGMRAFMYGGTASLFTVIFPEKYFGRLYGSVALCSSAILFSQFGLFAVTERVFNGDPSTITYVLLGLNTSMIIFPIYLFYLRTNRQEDDGEIEGMMDPQTFMVGTGGGFYTYPIDIFRPDSYATHQPMVDDVSMPMVFPEPYTIDPPMAFYAPQLDNTYQQPMESNCDYSCQIENTEGVINFPKLFKNSNRSKNEKEKCVEKFRKNFMESMNNSPIISLFNKSIEFNERYDINRFLLKENNDFQVIGIIGDNRSGKSTLLSLLTGNQFTDNDKDYSFPTKHNNAYVRMRIMRNDNTIFLDSKNLLTQSMVEWKDPAKLADTNFQQVKLATWLTSVCHVLIVMVDDDSSEQLRKLLSIVNTVKPTLRKTEGTVDCQLIFVHNKFVSPNSNVGHLCNSLMNLLPSLKFVKSHEEKSIQNESIMTIKTDSIDLSDSDDDSSDDEQFLALNDKFTHDSQTILFRDAEILLKEKFSNFFLTSSTNLKKKRSIESFVNVKNRQSKITERIVEKFIRENGLKIDNISNNLENVGVSMKNVTSTCMKSIPEIIYLPQADNFFTDRKFQENRSKRSDFLKSLSKVGTFQKELDRFSKILSTLRNKTSVTESQWLTSAKLLLNSINQSQLMNHCQNGRLILNG
ncbi:hypothetical protein SNEBB_008318 [Seison nebaliae]|nr:hypothetical protein SNEBB_008318 [Seison nebaliae]